jgi:hypothetical protein
MVPDDEWLEDSAPEAEAVPAVSTPDMNRSDRNRLLRCRPQITSDLDVRMVMDQMIGDRVLDNRKRKQSPLLMQKT